MLSARPFGQSPLRISSACLGTMAFGAGVATDEAARILDVFEAHGGTFLDTANTFSSGDSERVLGALLDGRRERFVLGTKFGRSTDPSAPGACGTDRHAMRRALEASLARLRTDHVDVLWAHAWDPATPLEELARALEEALQSGKARAVGVADAPAWAIARAHSLLCGPLRIDGALVEYGLAARDAERELLPMCASLGMTPLAWGTLSGELLVGDAEAVRARLDSSGDYYARRRGAAAARVGEVLRALAAARAVSPAVLALAWLRAACPPVIPVLGPPTAAALAERLEAWRLEVDPEALAQLEACSVIDLGFPSEYLRDPSVMEEIYGRSTPEAHARAMRERLSGG